MLSCLHKNKRSSFVRHLSSVCKTENDQFIYQTWIIPSVCEPCGSNQHHVFVCERNIILLNTPLGDVLLRMTLSCAAIKLTSDWPVVRLSGRTAAFLTQLNSTDSNKINHICNKFPSVLTLLHFFNPRLITAVSNACTYVCFQRDNTP